MSKNINAEDVLAYSFLTRARQTRGRLSSATDADALAYPEEGLDIIRAFVLIKDQTVRLAAVKFIKDLARLDRSDAAR